MKERFITGFCIFFVVLVMFSAKIILEVNWIFDVFIGLIAIAGAFEIAKIFKKMGLFNHEYLIGIFPLLFYAIIILGILTEMPIYLFILLTVALIIVLAVVSIIISYIKKTDTVAEMRVRNIRTSVWNFSVTKAGQTILGFFYPTMLFMILILFNHLEELGFIFNNVGGYNSNLSIIALALAFLIPFICDTFAYLMGNLIGGKKLCPKVSPIKTISGAVGGVLWTSILLVALFLIFSADTVLTPVLTGIGFEWWHFAIIGIITGIACVYGDLFESLLKRKANMKDSADILPGHGGITDRIDSFVFSTPIIFIFLLFFIV